MEDSLLSYIEQLSPSWRAFFLSCLLASAQRLFSRCLLLAARSVSVEGKKTWSLFRNMARLSLRYALHSQLAGSFIHLLMNSLLRQKRLVASFPPPKDA